MVQVQCIGHRIIIKRSRWWSSGERSPKLLKCQTLADRFDTDCHRDSDCKGDCHSHRRRWNGSGIRDDAKAELQLYRVSISVFCLLTFARFD